MGRSGHLGHGDHFHRFGRHGAWGECSGWGGFHPGLDVEPLRVGVAPYFVAEEPEVVHSIDVIPTIRTFQRWETDVVTETRVGETSVDSNVGVGGFGD